MRPIHAQQGGHGVDLWVIWVAGSNLSIWQSRGSFPRLKFEHLEVSTPAAFPGSNLRV